MQQTHFLGVLPPEELACRLEGCRRYMKETYGCKSGYGTPIHATLVPPFCLPEEYSTKDLVAAMEEHVLPLGNHLKFTSQVKGFDAFGDRTIFARVLEDKRWSVLRDRVLAAVLQHAPNCARKDRSPFHPHLTVANRDIPAGVSTDALKVLNELRLTATFSVDNVTIFERQGGSWTDVWSGAFGCH